MRTTIQPARGKPLAILLLTLVVSLLLGATAWGSSIQVMQSLDEQEIFVAGMGESPEVAVLTMTLHGIGPVDRYPVDCMIVIDASATADLGAAKQFAFDLMSRLGPDDRVGLVTFGTTADLRVGLTKNLALVRTVIADLGVGGKSALGLGLQAARRELTQNGRDDALLLEVILSDGQNNVGQDPNVEGDVAAENGIMMIPVGVGTLINRNRLEDYANETNGLFFPRPTQTALEQIADHIVVSTAAEEIVITKTLPEGLRLVSASPSPTRVETTSMGLTTAVWRVTNLMLGQRIDIEILIKGTEKGDWETDEDSFVVYSDFRGVVQTADLEAERLLVVMPNRVPFALFEVESLDVTTADVVTFTDHSFDIDEDGSIAEWRWDFGDETTSLLQNPTHRFAESGIYMVSLIAVDERGAESEAYELEVAVGNAKPVAGFVVRDIATLAELESPRVGVEILLDASSSYDFDGSIAYYEWDFNSDGVVDLETSEAEAETTFVLAGEIEVTLSVVDDENTRTYVTKTVDVLSSVTAVRTIDTCLPDDRTAADGVVTVTITLTANTTLNGLTVSETIPEGWTFTEIENDSATKRVNGQTIEWIFWESFADDGVDAQRVIRYELVPPMSAKDQDFAGVPLLGLVGSSSPRLSQQISGDDRLAVAEFLPIPVVISRWNVETGALDPCLRETISFDQIHYAVSLWIDQDSVPYTDNQLIDLAVIQDLIAYWLTDTSVHDPLP